MEGLTKVAQYYMSLPFSAMKRNNDRALDEANDIEKAQLRLRKAQDDVNYVQRARRFDTTANQRRDAQQSYRHAQDRVSKAREALRKAREKKEKKEKVKEEGIIKLIELTPAEQAKKLGLKHKGWGRYADKSGKVVAKSEKGKLVKLKDKEKLTAPDKTPKTKPKEVDAQTILAKKVGEQLGSNPGGFYKGADGQLRYVKFYPDPDQGRGEHLANNIYRDLGIGAPKSHLFDSEEGAGFASDIIEGKTLEDIEHKKGDIPKQLARDILKGFAADILTGNWDAVGLEHDNILVSKDGTPYRIDNGGTFTFRAQAGKKPKSLLHKITEFHGLADPEINREYAEIFDAAGIHRPEDMDREFKRQVKKIVALRKKHGNWLNYVKKTVPNWDRENIREVAKMLEARTKLLVNKAKKL